MNVKAQRAAAMSTRDRFVEGAFLSGTRGAHASACVGWSFKVPNPNPNANPNLNPNTNPNPNLNPKPTANPNPDSNPDSNPYPNPDSNLTLTLTRLVMAVLTAVVHWPPPRGHRAKGSAPANRTLGGHPGCLV